jgi:CBS domain-containing protein
VLTKVVDHPDIWSHPIEEVMTHNPLSVNANQTAGEALKMMDSLHFRNAPVLDNAGKIVGNLTHFSLIRYLSEAFPEEVLNLPPTSDNFGENREGG